MSMLWFFLMACAELHGLELLGPRRTPGAPVERLPGAVPGPSPMEIEIGRRDGRADWRLLMGQSAALVAVLRYDDGSRLDITALATWVSDDTTVAALELVSPGGCRLRARTPGRVRVVARLDDLHGTAVAEVESPVPVELRSWAAVKGLYGSAAGPASAPGSAAGAGLPSDRDAGYPERVDSRRQASR